MSWHDALQYLRLVTLITMGVSAGMIARYFGEQPRMPWLAFLGFLSYSAAATGAVAFNLTHSQGFQWWATPFCLLGALLIIVGLAPKLSIRHEWRFNDRSNGSPNPGSSTGPRPDPDA